MAHAHAQSHFGAVKTTRVIDFDYALESSFSMTEKKRSLRNEKLKANTTSETEEQRKEKLKIEDKT